jgi:hypothetical protein
MKRTDDLEAKRRERADEAAAETADKIAAFVGLTAPGAYIADYRRTKKKLVSESKTP